MCSPFFLFSSYLQKCSLISKDLLILLMEVGGKVIIFSSEITNSYFPGDSQTSLTSSKLLFSDLWTNSCICLQNKSDLILSNFSSLRRFAIFIRNWKSLISQMKGAILRYFVSKRISWILNISFPTYYPVRWSFHFCFDT